MSAESERSKPRDGVTMVYALAGAVALIAGGVAIAVAFDGENGSPASEPSVAEPASVEPIDEPESDLPDIDVDLPAVPDLENEPPPSRPSGSDPRAEQLGAEMRMLSRARELSAEHPAEALGVLDQHRAEYRDGVLREEREAFAIEILVELEHVDAAERRYYDFLIRYPRSDFRERLERAMERPVHPVGPTR